MPLSWNEIRHNAIQFSHDWTDSTRESADKQTFWNEFFVVFGIRRKVVASFEEPVKKISGHYGFIDLFWPGMLLVEHKSRGEDLGKAQSQAFQYIHDLIREGRQDEIPRYVVVSDTARIALHDLEPDESGETPLFTTTSRVLTTEFKLREFHKNIQAFAFIPGYKQQTFKNQDPINLKAVAIIGNLHDTLTDCGFSGHSLERFLVRVLFCLFAQDTGIFERQAFKLYIENHTKEDGTDLGAGLAHLFEILNTPEDKRQTTLMEDLRAFRYINGALFKEFLGIASFNRDMRNALLACTRFDWSSISPAIFGSLFQAVMLPKERRQAGAHFTSERDILKVIRPLFLDDLRRQFEFAKRDVVALKQLQKEIAQLRFLDPACGCGNFLVIAYRELRLLELDILKALRGKGELSLSFVDVDAFNGIEINEWPARIAEVAMWLMDHQMNNMLSIEFGSYFVRLPLSKQAKIVHGNALRIPWSVVIKPEECSYILGNPPFVGKHLMNSKQTEDMREVWKNNSGIGVLDYVTGWYWLAAQYIKGTKIVVGFVSTNSISQGEQVSALWQPLFRTGIRIHFAYRTFSWESEARGKAHVHVVIIGFANFDPIGNLIYEHHNDIVSRITVRNISPYLMDGSNIAVESRRKPLCNVPACEYGNKPTDGGFLIVEESDRKKFLAENPGAKKYLRPLLCAEEYLNNIPRWCLWLVDAPADVILDNPGIKERVKGVRDFRLASKKEPTRCKSETPTLFAEIRQPKKRYLVFPRHTSETRKYMPFGYFEPNVIIHDSCSAIPNATLYHFGVLSSSMHMAWVRVVCGRIKSDYRYSSNLVYNNFPWPENVTEKHKTAIETAAEHVLAVRTQCLEMGSTLAEIYNPLAMPPKLVKAHAKLDAAVDKAYPKAPFENDQQRIELLFYLYEKLTSPLLPVASKKRRR
ncbi:MAG: DNA methyltransferase [Planctomycetota bacterium]